MTLSRKVAETNKAFMKYFKMLTGVAKLQELAKGLDFHATVKNAVSEGWILKRKQLSLYLEYYFV